MKAVALLLLVTVGIALAQDKPIELTRPVGAWMNGDGGLLTITPDRVTWRMLLKGSTVKADYSITKDSVLYAVITQVSPPIKELEEGDTFSFRFRVDEGTLNLRELRGKYQGEKKQPEGLYRIQPDKGSVPLTIEPLDYINRVHVQFSEQQRFGIVCPKLRDPRNPQKPKLLTRDERGITNNTIVRIEGYEYLWGVEIPGVHYVKDKDSGKIIKEVPIPGKDKDRSWMTAWESEFGRVRVTQSVEIVMGEQTRLYDTVLVRYHLWNRDKTPHTVGLRIMLDTFIGSNDGVPFYIPPTIGKAPRLVDKMEIFAQKDIPDFVQALETGDLNDKEATLAVVGLKIKGAEPIEKMVICRWPQNSEARWGGGNGPGEWQYEPIDKNPNAKDSCVVLYWSQTNMKPDEHRDLAFTYGLGKIVGESKETVVGGKGQMRLFVGNRASLERPIVVTAYVKADDKQKVSLTLPEGLSLAEGQQAEQTIGAANRDGYAQVTWQVKATKTGKFTLQADGAGIGTAKEVVQVLEKSLFE
jgi:hypothetical protein